MSNKRFGVVEGFYRRQYTFSQRLDLIEYLRTLGLNTYVYGPKADVYHRRRWQVRYPKSKMKEFAKLNQHSIDARINFVYALSPGSHPNADAVVEKIDTMIDVGICHFSLFFDDISVPLNAETARSQVDSADTLFGHLRQTLTAGSLSFCPTQYRGFKRTEYLEYVASNLHRDIDIFWTGKNVVSWAITERDVARIRKIIRRQVLIWDNIFANDYIPGKILRFPYRRRSPGIVNAVRGILINPMNNYPESKPLIKTAAMFFLDPYGYNTRTAWKKAVAGY
ncbi:MAG: beta-N-acetylglucosaminidase domain-containing protein [candidate division WOR-3 bacterium]|nr:MAG: beta-N-acetylglucosaminidase domain-containing protein [candidate division WOR-3 bacterium]